MLDAVAEAVQSSVILGALGALLLVGAYGFFKRRHFRKLGWERWYHHQYRLLSTPMTNGPFTFLPIGLLLVVMAVGGLLLPLMPDVKNWDRTLENLPVMVGLLVVTVAFLVTVFGLLAVSLSALLNPPTRLMPRWVLDDEKRLSLGMPSLIPLPPERDHPVWAAWELQVVMVASVVLPAGVFFLGWPPSLLIGLGFGLSYLASYFAVGRRKLPKSKATTESPTATRNPDDNRPTQRDQPEVPRASPRPRRNDHLP